MLPDLIFADPPYWMRTGGVLTRVNGTVYDGCDDEWDRQFASLKDYNAFTRGWLAECRRALKDDGSLWVIGGMQCIYTIGAAMQDLGFWLINDVVWHKTNPTPNFRGTRLNNAHETLIWAVKSEKAKYTFNYKTAKELNRDNVSSAEFESGVRKQMGSVWRIPVCQGAERLKDESGQKLHSTQKPEALLYRIIAICSRLGDLVLDPFGGTMTTAAVAKRAGRKYIAIDNVKKYCEFGERRLAAVKEEIGEIERAAFDERPPRVTFAEMIAAGYFDSGEMLYYNGEGYLELTLDGKARSADGSLADIHSAISAIKGRRGGRLNGWDYWQVKRGDALVGIGEIRKKYIDLELRTENLELRRIGRGKGN